MNRLVYVNGVPVTGEMDGGQATDESGLRSFYIFVPDRTIRVSSGASVSIEGGDVLDVNADVAHGWIDPCCKTSKLPRHLYELDLVDAASMPSEPGIYLVDIRWTCAGCDPRRRSPSCSPSEWWLPKPDEGTSTRSMDS